MNLKYSEGLSTYRLLVFILIVFVLGIISFFLTPGELIQNFLNYMSGIAVIVLALLTASYVIVTSKQLAVMRGQLKEMGMTRNLQTQPLPFIFTPKCYLEATKCYYSPQI